MKNLQQRLREAERLLREAATVTPRHWSGNAHILRWLKEQEELRQT